LPQEKNEILVGIMEIVVSAKVKNLPKHILINEKIASICGTMSELVLAEQYSV